MYYDDGRAADNGDRRSYPAHPPHPPRYPDPRNQPPYGARYPSNHGYEERPPYNDYPPQRSPQLARATYPPQRGSYGYGEHERNSYRGDRDRDRDRDRERPYQQHPHPAEWDRERWDEDGRYADHERHRRETGPRETNRDRDVRPREPGFRGGRGRGRGGYQQRGGRGGYHFDRRQQRGSPEQDRRYRSYDQGRDRRARSRSRSPRRRDQSPSSPQRDRSPSELGQPPHKRLKPEDTAGSDRASTIPPQQSPVKVESAKAVWPEPATPETTGPIPPDPHSSADTGSAAISTQPVALSTGNLTPDDSELPPRYRRLSREHPQTASSPGGNAQPSITVKSERSASPVIPQSPMYKDKGKAKETMPPALTQVKTEPGVGSPAATCSPRQPAVWPDPKDTASFSHQRDMLAERGRQDPPMKPRGFIDRKGSATHGQSPPVHVKPPQIPPWKPHEPSALDREIAKTAAKSTTHIVEQSRLGHTTRRMQHELELAQMDFRLAQRRREITEGQFQQAKRGMLGIDAPIKKMPATW